MEHPIILQKMTLTVSGGSKDFENWAGGGDSMCADKENSRFQMI